jgi:hypothetical protein
VKSPAHFSWLRRLGNLLGSCADLGVSVRNTWRNYYDLAEMKEMPRALADNLFDLNFENTAFKAAFCI